MRSSSLHTCAVRIWGFIRDEMEGCDAVTWRTNSFWYGDMVILLCAFSAMWWDEMASLTLTAAWWKNSLVAFWTKVPSSLRFLSVWKVENWLHFQNRFHIYRLLVLMDTQSAIHSSNGKRDSLTADSKSMLHTNQEASVWLTSILHEINQQWKVNFHRKVLHRTKRGYSIMVSLLCLKNNFKYLHTCLRTVTWKIACHNKFMTVPQHFMLD